MLHDSTAMINGGCLPVYGKPDTGVNVVFHIKHMLTVNNCSTKLNSIVFHCFVFFVCYLYYDQHC